MLVGIQSTFSLPVKMSVIQIDATRPWGDLALEMSGKYNKMSTPPQLTEREKNVRLYLDMSDEPWKYGDDIFAWELLHEKVYDHPKVIAYWAEKDAQNAKVFNAERIRLRTAYGIAIKQAAKVAMKRWIDNDIKRIVGRFRKAATKIQALVRGYQTRCRNPHLDCCMCLSHRICPLKTTVGFMCRDCALMGPYEDVVEEDPWNWHRAECVKVCA